MGNNDSPATHSNAESGGEAQPASRLHRYPTGAIAQVENGKAGRLFIEAVKPPTILLKIHHARQLLDRGETAETWIPEESKVITSTAIHDTRNNALPLEGNGYKRGEWDIVREFKPDYHIPADRPDYSTLPDSKRYEQVKECMVGTITLANHVADAGLNTTILPWVKGTTPEERQLAYRTVEQLGMDYAVVYANGYFNDGTGVRIDDLVADIETLTAETARELTTTDGPLSLAVLNCQSPNVLERLPESVVAGSGLWGGQRRGWRETVTPTTQSEAEMLEIFEDVDDRVHNALGLARNTNSRGRTGTLSNENRDAIASIKEEVATDEQ